MKKWVLPLVVVGFLLGGPGLGMGLVIAFHGDLIGWFAEQGIYISSLILMLIGGASVGFALLPSFFLGAIIGFVLPFQLAFPVATLAICLATVIGIGVSNFFSPELIKGILQTKKSWAQTYDRLQTLSSGTSAALLTSLRVAPQMPFALTNFLCAAWPLPLKKIIFWSFLGLLPRTFFALSIGNGASRIEEFLNRGISIWELGLSGAVFALFVWTLFWAKKKVAAPEY